MADDNDAKPPRTAADKEKSRQQSRPVSGKEAAKGVSGQPGKAQKSAGQKPATTKGAAPKGTPAKGAPSKGGPAAKGPQPKGGQAKGGTGPGRGGQNRGPATKSGGRGGGQRPPLAGTAAASGPPRRSPTALLTWGAVALILIIVVVLLVVKITSGSNASSGQKAFIPTTPQVAHDVTNIPTSVYNQVGIKSSLASVSPPTIVGGQPPLTIAGLPGMYYFGAEYCPYCAAERWAVVASLSRFGKWANLGDMQSTTNDVFPGTQTFTLVKSTFTSPYLGLQTTEANSDQPLPNGQGYKTLQRATAAQRKLVSTYDTPKYFPGSGTGGGIPFISIGNKAFISGASYSPSILQGLSRSDIASNLSDASNPVTQAIVATSNYISASICHTNGGKPASVCTSSGVMAAAKALKISP